MRSWVGVGVMAMMLATVNGCDENEDPELPKDEMLGGSHVPSAWGDGGTRGESPTEPPAFDDLDDDWADDDSDDEWQNEDAGSVSDGGTPVPAPGPDAGPGQSIPSAPIAPSAPSSPSLPPAPVVSNDGPRSAVPAELVGVWEHGTIDFELWENYKPEYWAGRNAIPTREAMIFRADGTAKFYRYEGLFKFCEELIDCEGTVTFHGNGTFTFHPVRGRKRFYDNSQRILQTDRALNDQELAEDKLAGTRGYRYLPSNEPPAIEITVPSSAPYKWYRKQ